MTRKRPPMRTGLDELLGKTAALAQSADDNSLPVADLRPGAGQPRRTFDDASLASLAQSIQSQGVLQPLLVRPVGDRYEIIAGERRWRAAQLAGLSEVPVMIRELTDQQARVAGLIENLQREDLNAVDEVDAKLDLVASLLSLPRDDARTRLMQMLREEPGEDHATVQAAFDPLGEIWQSFAKNKLRILKWPALILDAVRQGLPFTLGSVIVGAPEEHHAALIALAQGGASRQELQTEIKRLTAGGPSKAQDAARVGRLLTSNRFLGGLDPDGRNALERWLSKMPDVVRGALKD